MRKLKSILILIAMLSIMVIGTAFAAGWNFFIGQVPKAAQVPSLIDEKEWQWTYSPKSLLVGNTIYFVYDAKTYVVGDTYKGNTIRSIDLNFSRETGFFYFQRSSITSIVFEPSCKNFLPTTMDYWFDGLLNVTSITGLENLNVSQVRSMSSLFYGCTKLGSLDLSTWDTSACLEMNEMFRRCTSLTSLDLSSFDTSNVMKMNNMFNGCTNLRTIYADPDLWDISSITQGNGMFTGCNNLSGGAGTTFNSNNTSFAMAKIDGYMGQVGYLTNIFTR